jgi:hypothetical protein
LISLMAAAAAGSGSWTATCTCSRSSRQQWLTETRATARRLDLLALARPPRTSVRQRIGATLIGLGEWFRDAGAVVPVRSAVR